MDRRRIGILGCGVISGTYIKDIRKRYPALEITACADADPGRAKACAEQYGIPVYGDLTKLLECEEVELVVNLTPPKLHYELNKKILEAGKHLFCEKPFALAYEQALELKELALEKKLSIGGAPDTFLGAGLQRTAALLDGGAIGKPLYAHMAMTTCGVETWHPSPAQFYQYGAGPLYDMGPYYLTAAAALFGPIEEILAVDGTGMKTRRIYSQPLAGQEFTVETPTYYAALLKLRGGMTVNLTVSFDIWQSTLPMFEIYGTQGTLSVPDPNMYAGMPDVTRMEEVLEARSIAVPRKALAGADYPDEEELRRLYQGGAEYARGAGVMEMSRAMERGLPCRTGPDLLCHVVEALCGIMKAASDGKPYKMQSTCGRPKPLTAEEARLL